MDEKSRMRLIQIWVPDVHSPEFRDAAHRQSVAVAESDREADDQAFVDDVAELGP